MLRKEREKETQKKISVLVASFFFLVIFYSPAPALIPVQTFVFPQYQLLV